MSLAHRPTLLVLASIAVALGLVAPTSTATVTPDAAATPSVQKHNGPRPSGLTVGQRTAPVDVDNVAAPLLGWKVPADRQTAYQVQVATNRRSLMSGRSLTWDSDKTRSSASTNVAYAGPELERGERYVWRVRTWNERGRRSPWSRVSTFGTALGAEWGASEPIWLGEPESVRWHDYTIETTFSITSQNATIVFNAEDPNNYLMWQLRGDGVNELAPHDRVDGEFRELKTVPLDIDLERDTDYRLRIEVDGDSVSTYLDGAHVDTTDGVRFTSGSIGFRTGRSERNSWDDLTVTAADGT
ncbi:MAG: hypothetical protein L0K86_26620, partial [Actinomycetia bacterium]|nr:hypothetical protein [Actinomycetes bacterium]